MSGCWSRARTVRCLVLTGRGRAHAGHLDSRRTGLHRSRQLLWLCLLRGRKWYLLWIVWSSRAARAREERSWQRPLCGPRLECSPSRYVPRFRTHRRVIDTSHVDCVRPILPLLAALLAESKAADIAFTISVFYTRAVTADHSFEDLELPTGLSLTPGRLDVYSILVGSTMHTTSPRGMFIGVCGPSSLGASVRKAMRDVNNRIPDTVGRFHLHEE